MMVFLNILHNLGFQSLKLWLLNSQFWPFRMINYSIVSIRERNFLNNKHLTFEIKTIGKFKSHCYFSDSSPANYDDSSTQTLDSGRDSSEPAMNSFIAGYNDCFEETVQFLVETSDRPRGGDHLSSGLFGHLRQHLDEVVSKSGKPDCWRIRHRVTSTLKLCFCRKVFSKVSTRVITTQWPTGSWQRLRLLQYAER